MYNWDKFTGDPISEASQVKQPPHFLWPCEHEEEKLLREKSQKLSWQDPCWKRNLRTTMSSSVSKFFLLTKKKKRKKKQSNQQTSSHILSPWWIAVSRGPLPLLPQHLHSSLIPRLPFSTFSRRIFLPSCLCTPSHFPHPVKSLMMFMLLSLACVKVQTPSRQGLPQSPWGVPAGLGLWSRSGQPIK